MHEMQSWTCFYFKIVTVEESCPADYVQYMDRCLSLKTEGVLWETAVVNCYSEDADLVELDTPELAMFARSLIYR